MDKFGRFRGACPSFVFNNFHHCSPSNPFIFTFLHCCPGVYPPLCTRQSPLPNPLHSNALANAQFASPLFSNQCKLPGGVPPCQEKS
jgi:hypothetical protein